MYSRAIVNDVKKESVGGGGGDEATLLGMVTSGNSSDHDGRNGTSTMKGKQKKKKKEKKPTRPKEEKGGGKKMIGVADVSDSDVVVDTEKDVKQAREEEEQLKSIWKMLDVDGSGLLSSEETRASKTNFCRLLAESLLTRAISSLTLE
eukprot:SAG11_NODE_420_length_9631_cov_12.805558_10_plen_148_part_00